MNDLTDFMLGQIAKDVTLALAAQAESPTPWHDDEGTLDAADHRSIAGYAGPATSPHIVRHDPARVLADLESKRRIVEAFTDNLHERWDDGGHEAAKVGEVVLRLLALPYADREDYREEWRI